MFFAAIILRASTMNKRVFKFELIDFFSLNVLNKFYMICKF